MHTPAADHPAASPPAEALVGHSDAMAALVERLGRSTLAVIGRREAIASAVVWRAGLVVTAAHVFRRTPAAATLAGADGTQVAATLVGIDSATDLALFRLADTATGGATPLPAGAPGEVRPGQLALAVGRAGEGDLIASAGIVNRVSGPWQTWLGGHVDRQIRLDGGVYEGLSGAGVSDAAGRVMGVATSALSRSYGVVVPSSTVDRVVDALLANGSVARPWLGIGAQPVPLPGQPGSAGLLVTSLAAGGPADKAGVLVGDIVSHAASTAIGSLRDLRSALAAHVGRSVPLAIVRGGAPTALAAQVGEWPTERRCH